MHYPGTYAAGCYDRLPDQVAGRQVENENLPNWLDVRFAVDDGDWVDLSAARVLEYRLTLDLRRGDQLRSGARRRAEPHPVLAAEGAAAPDAESDAAVRPVSAPRPRSARR